MTSAAAAYVELAINFGVLRTDMLKIAGILRWNVTDTRLAVADRRVADQSRILFQQWALDPTCGFSRRFRTSYGLGNRPLTVE
jgi:hypothetical protein